MYWGAYVDGDPTYRHYYPTERAWTDAPWDSATWDRFERNAGKKVSILHYGQPPMWEQGFATGPANACINRGAIPFIDMSSKSVPLTDIAAGKYDTQIAAWASQVKAWNHALFVRWNWEMNGSWFPWGAQAKANPGAFVASWRRVVDITRNIGAPVTWCWCPNTVFTGSTPLASLWPGDDYVDWSGIDGYNFAGLRGDPWRSFHDVIRPTYDAVIALAPGKPLMIAETGSTELGGSKPAWISAIPAALSAMPQIAGFQWFNWRIYEPGPASDYRDWPIESSSTATSAFQAMIADPRFAANTFGNIPAAKIPRL